MKRNSHLTLGAAGALTFALATAAALALRSTTSAAQAAAAQSSAAPAQSERHHGAAAQSGLRRVPAAPDEKSNGALAAPVPGADFDASAWSERLSDAQLEQRERAFDELLQLARREPAARAWLEERSRESGELAWTCRMALRALPPAHAPFGMSDPDAMADIRARIEQLQQRLEQLGAPGSVHAPRAFRFAFPPQALAPSAPAPSAKSTRESFTLEQGSGGCVLKITRGAGDDERVEEYRAESLEALLQAHPELREVMGNIDASAQVLELPQLFFGGPGFSGTRAWGSLPPGFGSALAPSGPLGWSWPDGPSAGEMRTDLLGVWIDPLGAERRAQLELPEGRGLLVARVEPFTLASVLGIAAGDVLVELNGRAIASRDDVSAALAEREPQAELRATWFDSMNQKRTRSWRPVTSESSEPK
jgi:hypothetical protein